MVPVHRLDPAKTALDPEVLLEDFCILEADGQQRIDRLIRHVVAESARHDRLRESTKLQVLALPLVDQGGVDLADQVMMAGEHPEQLLVGLLPHPWFGASEVARELLAGQALSYAVDRERKREAVREHVIEGVDRVAPGYVLDVDDLLFGFRERVVLEPADRFEMVPEISRCLEQPGCAFLIHLLPPEIEEQDAVLQ